MIKNDEWATVMVMSWVLIAVVYGVLIGIVYRKRTKFYTKEFMSNNFGELHENNFRQLPPTHGYPDQGNGIFANKLTYSQWFEFNCAQRCHFGAIEHLVIFAPISLLVTTYSNLIAAILNVVWALGRMAFTFGYLIHPDKRGIGALIMDLGILGSLFMLGVSAWDFIF